MPIDYDKSNLSNELIKLMEKKLNYYIVFSNSIDTKLSFYDIEDDIIVKVINVYKENQYIDRIDKVFWSPDQTMMAYTFESSNKFCIYDLVNNNFVKEYYYKYIYPYIICFSHDNSLIAIVDNSNKNKIKIINVEKSNIIKGFTLMDEIHTVISLQFSLNGKFLLAASNKVIKIWSLENFQLHKSIEHNGGHLNSITNVLFLNDEYIIYGLTQSKIIIKNIDDDSLEKIIQIDTIVRFIKFITISKNNKILIVLNTNNTLSVWDLLNTKFLYTINYSCVGEIKNIILSNDNKYLLVHIKKSIYFNKFVTDFIDASTGNVIKQFDDGNYYFVNKN